MSKDYISIAMAMPAVKDYSKQKITDSQFNEILATIQWWVPGQLKRACISKSIESPWEMVLCKKFRDTEWEPCRRDIFEVLKLPTKYSYKIYESISDLDSFIYKILHPFQLEHNRETLLKLEQEARKPLTEQQLKQIKL